MTGPALILILACVLLRTALSSDTTEYKQASKIATDYVDAVTETKMAYSALESVPTRTADHRHVTEPSRRPLTRLQRRILQQWETLAKIAPSRRVWERLGIVRSLLHRGDSMDAFQRIAAVPVRSTAKRNTSRPLTTSNLMNSGAVAALPSAQEVALWQSIYGTAPLPASQVGSLRAQLTVLKLGWFEHIAAERLYGKVGMTAQARHEAVQVRNSVRLVETVQTLQGLLVTLGTLGLILAGMRAFYRAVTAKASPAAASNVLDFAADFVIPPSRTAPPVRIVLPSEPLQAIHRRPMDRISLGYDTRILTFVAYLALMTLIGLPVSLLSPLFRHWSAQALLRLDILLELALTVPTVLLPIVFLRFLASREESARLSWSTLRKTLGFRSDGIGGDVLAGLRQYVLVLPLFLLISVLSDVIFRKFQTPINPVQLLTLGTQDPIDRLLLLFTAAVVAPVCEELFFRGILYPALRERWGVPGGIVLSAAIFAGLHPTLPAGFLPIWLLGVAFALLFEKRRSLLPGMIMHGLHNGFLLIAMFVALSD